MSFVNYWRLGILLVCLASLFILLNRFRVNRRQWNEKTRDYWYGFLMWSIAGISSSTEGIVRHVPFRVSIIFITAASVGTLLGLRRKGGWGTNNER